jgi:glutathione synthase/RimK-type ligase-like ATP-grasp enzyme
MTARLQTSVPASSSSAPWPPRLAQEKRLAWLDALLKGGFATTDDRIERAALLTAIDRPLDARDAYIDILRQAPGDFTALNDLGTLLAGMRMTDAACLVYAEAIRHHPTNPMPLVNLANLLHRRGESASAREHYERALQLAPDHPHAHQGIGTVLADLGEITQARAHFKIGYRGHEIATLTYRGAGRPISVLLLLSSGGGNIPTTPFLDDRTFAISAVMTDYLDPAAALPPHDIIFNAAGDADFCEPALDAAIELIRRSKAPVLNDPAAVRATTRVANATRLGGLPGVMAAQTMAWPRDRLVGDDGATALAHDGFRFPLLLRSPGFHTGRNFVRVESADQLCAAAAELPGDELLVIQYLDARGSDGNARKYRVMFIGGAIYPLHLAISEKWKVHYFTANMTDRPDHRAEEQAFLRDMPAVIGGKAMRALQAIRDALGLDYGGIDFGLSPEGDLLLFEANATMVVIPPDSDPRWDYRREAVAKIIDAATSMVSERAVRA